MQSNAHIVMSREKTEVHTQGEQPGDEPLFVVKSNRTAFTISSGETREDLVVRGYTLPGTIRMTAMVIDAFMDDSTIFRGGRQPDWESLWGITRSRYESRFMPDSWVAVYVNGDPIYSSIATEQLDAFEKAAQGGEVTRQVAEKATQKLVPSSNQCAVDHDSQIAVVLSVVKSEFKCSILERHGGETRSFAFKVRRKNDAVPVPTVLSIAADVIECMNHSSFLSRVQAMAWSDRIGDTSVTPDRVQAAMGRYRELLHFLAGYETAHHIEYFPDKPEALQMTQSKSEMFRNAEAS